jgi:hypothetical protein
MAVERLLERRRAGSVREALVHVPLGFDPLRSVAAALVAVSTGGPTPAGPLRTALRDAVNPTSLCLDDAHGDQPPEAFARGAHLMPVAAP